LRKKFRFFLFYWVTSGSMHLGLGRTGSMHLGSGSAH